MVPSLADGGQLHNKNGDRAEQKQMNHAAFMKNNAQHEPGQKKYQSG